MAPPNGRRPGAGVFRRSTLALTYGLRFVSSLGPGCGTACVSYGLRRPCQRMKIWRWRSLGVAKNMSFPTVISYRLMILFGSYQRTSVRWLRTWTLPSKPRRMSANSLGSGRRFSNRRWRTLGFAVNSLFLAFTLLRSRLYLSGLEHISQVAATETFGVETPWSGLGDSFDSKSY